MTITVTHAFVSTVPDDPSVPQEVRPSNWNAAHVVTGAVSLPLPFFGLSNPPWVRPSLNIGGPSSAFNTWLNQGGQVYAYGATAFSNNGTGPAVAPGTVYAPGDTITIAGGTGTAAVGTITDTQLVSATIVSPGGSGTPGPAQVIGTTGAGPQLFILNVTIGGGGGISSIDSVNNAGDYTANPTVLAVELVADNSSSGITGATVSIVMGALAAVPTNPGVYTVNPTNPAGQSSSSGSGTGATWNLSISAFATATDGSGGLPLVVQVPSAPDLAGSYFPTALLKPLGVEPWTVVMGMAAVAVVNGSAPNAPVVLYDSHSDIALFTYWGTDGSLVLVLISSASNPAMANAPSTKQFAVNSDYFGWWKVQDDGTNITLSFSAENVIYLPFFQDLISNFGATFDYVGFGADRRHINTSLATLTANGGATSALSPLWNFTQTSP